MKSLVFYIVFEISEFLCEDVGIAIIDIVVFFLCCSRLVGSTLKSLVIDACVRSDPLKSHNSTQKAPQKISVMPTYEFFPTTFMLMGLLNSLAQALRRHSWISSFRTPSGKRQVIVVVVGPLSVL